MQKHILHSFIFFFTYSLLSAQTDPNLVFHFPMDGSATEVIGNVKNENLIGGTSVEDRYGNEDGAFYFDGEEDSYTADLNEDLCVENGVTISAWIKHSNITGANTFFTIMNRDTFLYNCYNALVWRFSHSMHCIGYTGVCKWDTTRSIENTDQWYHVAGSIHVDIKSKKAKSIIYIDGDKKLSNSKMIFSSNLKNLNRIELSSRSVGTNEGTFDDLRIYNRVLTECEIQALALGHEPSECADHAPISCTPPEPLKTIIYPNPSSGLVRIHEEDRPSEHLIPWQLIDIQGRLIADGITRCNDDQLDLRSYPSGIYFLKFKNQHQKVILF